jgi:hypothetical protein
MPSLNKPSATMKTTDMNLQIRVSSLDSLLASPRPDDSKWTEQLLSALEQVTEFALNPGTPVRASSRVSPWEACVA